MDSRKFYSIYCSLVKKTGSVPVPRNLFFTLPEITHSGDTLFIQIIQEKKESISRKLEIHTNVSGRTCRFSVAVDKITYFDITDIEGSVKFILMIRTKECSFSIVV